MTATVSTVKIEHHQFKVKNRRNSKEEVSCMGLMKDHSAADDWTQEFGTQRISHCS